MLALRLMPRPRDACGPATLACVARLLAAVRRCDAAGQMPFRARPLVERLSEWLQRAGAEE